MAAGLPGRAQGYVPILATWGQKHKRGDVTILNLPKKENTAKGQHQDMFPAQCKVVQVSSDLKFYSIQNLF